MESLLGKEQIYVKGGGYDSSLSNWNQTRSREETLFGKNVELNRSGLVVTESFRPDFEFQNLGARVLVSVNGQSINWSTQFTLQDYLKERRELQWKFGSF